MPPNGHHGAPRLAGQRPVARGADAHADPPRVRRVGFRLRQLCADADKRLGAPERPAGSARVAAPRDLAYAPSLRSAHVAQAEAANPLYLSYLKDFEVFEPVAARTTGAAAIQIGNAVSIDKAVDALRRVAIFDGSVDVRRTACAALGRNGRLEIPQARRLVNGGKPIVRHFEFKASRALNVD